MIRFAPLATSARSIPRPHRRAATRLVSTALAAWLTAIATGCGHVVLESSSVDGGMRVAPRTDAGDIVDAALDSGADALDAAVLADSGAVLDAHIAPPDAGALLDAGTFLDAGSPMSASDSDAGMPRDPSTACHDYPIGSEPVPLRRVASLPAMTGGDIPLGTYDLVDVQLTGPTTGTISTTWVFESSSTAHHISGTTIGGGGPVIVQSYVWSTSGTRLSLQQTCPGADSSMWSYSVRVEGGVTYLDMQVPSLMFTFRRR